MLVTYVENITREIVNIDKRCEMNLEIRPRCANADEIFHFDPTAPHNASENIGVVLITLENERVEDVVP